MLAVVERYVDGLFRARVEQAFAQRVFAHYVDYAAVGNAVGDVFPGLAAVVRAIDVWSQIVQAKCVDRRVSSIVVEMRSVDQRDFGPRFQIGRRDISPGLTAVARDVDQAVIGSGPDSID